MVKNLQSSFSHTILHDLSNLFHFCDFPSDLCRCTSTNYRSCSRQNYFTISIFDLTSPNFLFTLKVRPLHLLFNSNFCIVLFFGRMIFLRNFMTYFRKIFREKYVSTRPFLIPLRSLRFYLVVVFRSPTYSWLRSSKGYP